MARPAMSMMPKIEADALSMSDEDWDFFYARTDARGPEQMCSLATKTGP